MFRSAAASEPAPAGEPGMWSERDVQSDRGVRGEPGEREDVRSARDVQVGRSDRSVRSERSVRRPSRGELARGMGWVTAGSMLANILGYLLGYLTGKVMRQPETASRTMAVEVGMQNSGLAATLAAQYMNPVAALPAAVFSVWHNLSGAVFAFICRSVDQRKRAMGAPSDTEN